MFHAEKMRTKDFQFAVQLANTMDWNMAEEDFEFMLKLEPNGCFVLFDNAEPVGIATCISYGKTGWFGNLAVKKEHRREGAGTFLLKHSVDYLLDRGLETIGLYAYQHLIGFYEKVGFKPHDDFGVWSGKPVIHKNKVTFREVNQQDIAAVVEFFLRCLGEDRQKLLKALLLKKGTAGYLALQDDEVIGVVLAKIFQEMAEIGPLLCQRDHADVAATLLKTTLHRLCNMEVYACVPAKEKNLVETLKAAGLEEKFRVTRMFLGAFPTENCVYLAESLERG